MKYDSITTDKTFVKLNDWIFEYLHRNLHYVYGVTDKVEADDILKVSAEFAKENYDIKDALDIGYWLCGILTSIDLITEILIGKAHEEET